MQGCPLQNPKLRAFHINFYERSARPIEEVVDAYKWDLRRDIVSRSFLDGKQATTDLSTRRVENDLASVTPISLITSCCIDAVDGVRRLSRPFSSILLQNAKSFWIRLYCEDLSILQDQVCVVSVDAMRRPHIDETSGPAQCFFEPCELSAVECLVPEVGPG